MSAEANAVKIVAELMALSARTAPKGRGVDALVIRIASTAGEMKALAEEMRILKEKPGHGFFERDAKNIEQSDACLLIGCKKDSTVGLDCGGCGYRSCKEMLKAQEDLWGQGKTFQGPGCIIRLTDLGIALGSAAKTASIHNVDNRIMYSAGVGALSLGWLEGCAVAYGIPLKASGKSIYFDRTA